MRLRKMLSIVSLCGLSCSTAHADVLYAAVQDGSFNAVALFTPSLGFVSQVATAGPIGGITAGSTGGEFYVSVGNHVNEYSNAGTLLNTVNGSASTVTGALSFGSDRVYAALRDGSFYGVATFTNTLGFVSQVATDGPILGLAAGTAGDFYVSVGNHLDEYSGAGSLLHTVAGSPTTLTPSLAFGNGLVYAAVQDGSFNGVAMFTPTLGFVSQIATDGPILGIAAGLDSNFYASIGNHVNEYSSTGTLLHSISGSPTTLTPALSYYAAVGAVPEPSTWISMLVGLMFMAGAMHRTRSARPAARPRSSGTSSWR